MSCCPPTNHHREHALWLGLVAFVIGAVVLLQRFDLVPEQTWSFLWPSILVVSGLKMMVCCGTKTCESGESCDSGESCESGESCDSGKEECCGTCEPVKMPAPMKKSMKKKSSKK